jgi:hypothetical protein
MILCDDKMTTLEVAKDEEMIKIDWIMFRLIANLEAVKDAMIKKGDTPAQISEGTKRHVEWIHLGELYKEAIIEAQNIGDLEELITYHPWNL